MKLLLAEDEVELSNALCTILMKQSLIPQQSWGD